VAGAQLLPVRKFWPSDDDVVPSPNARRRDALTVDQFGQCRPVGFVADVPACSQPAASRSPARHLGQARLIALARSWSATCLSYQVADFQVAKCRSPSIIYLHSNSVILTQDHRRLVDQGLCGIGTAASSGVIFIDSVMMASGSSLASAMRVGGELRFSSVSRSCRYGRNRWPRPAAIRWPA
jgi:hypothetical protein